MLESIDWKLLAALVAAALSLGGFIPYIRDILRRRTKPHAYTWLVWTLTVGIACAGYWQGGAGLVLSLAMTANVALVFLVFLLSFRYGTRNITKGDTVALLVALVAIFVWVGLDAPILAVMLGTAIDLVGYWPTMRKSFHEPWSEHALTWGIYALAPFVALFAIADYNLLTVTYPAAVVVANVGLLVLLLARRRFVARPF